MFYQEVGLRLIGWVSSLIEVMICSLTSGLFFFAFEYRILHKHIKRQIISLSGGFQVIADLNTYYVFIASLKVSSCLALVELFPYSFVYRCPKLHPNSPTSRCLDTSMLLRMRGISRRS